MSTCACGCGKTVSDRQSRAANTLRYVHGHNRSSHGHARGFTKTLTFTSWDMMIQRCGNPNNDEWRNYGGRGISVCLRWRTFTNFLHDMGERPAGTSLDRINNNGSYEPGNCRWATPREQHNNKRCCHMLTANGESRTVTEWARYLGVPPTTLFKRLHLGWPIEKVLTRRASHV